MLTRNGFKLEAAWEIINCLECGYSGYLCELHNEVFNTDYYETYNPAAKKWFDEYDLSVFDVVDEIITYEKDNFGEVNTDFSNPCAVLNMYWYIIGDEVMQELMDGSPECDELWNCQLDENEAKFVLNYFRNRLEELY